MRMPLPDTSMLQFLDSRFRGNDAKRLGSRLLVAALLAAFTATPAAARIEPVASLTSYVQARAAASAGAYEQASAGYAAALGANPDNEVIATQAMSHAVTAGDWPLAVRAARVLERRNAMLPDARFLLVADAFRSRDWRAAGQQIDAIEHEQLFAFAVPVMRAWLAFGSRRGDPLTFLPAENDAASAAAAYAAEQRPLLLVAMRRPEGARQLLALPDQQSPRTIRLRLAAAATLIRRDRAGALALLQGEEGPLVAARSLVEARRPLRGGLDSAADGLAEVLVRLALDMNNQQLTAVAASFARLATWASPEDGQAWLIAAELYGQQDRESAAIALLSSVPADDPYAAAARDQRIRLLVQSDQDARALSEAEAAAAAATANVADLVRLGDVLMDQDRPVDAARAYARAQDLHTAVSDVPEWALWLFRGGAYDRAHDWPQARAALEQAYRLAPEQPLVLNYLGYAQLERRENLVEAERLVREAHRLAPDNAAITDSLGWALYLKGSLAEAIVLLEQAAQSEPADVEINEHLGDAYFSAGRRVDARYAWAAALVYADGDDATRLRTKIDRGLTPQLAAR